jgi:tetratricopeptide (TPR) repeat protein
MRMRPMNLTALLSLSIAVAALLPAAGVAAERSATPPKPACPRKKSLLMRATQLHQSGAITEAIDAYKRYLTACPNEAGARSNLGAAYAQAGRYDDAIAQYQKALATDRRSEAIRMNLAIAFYKAERLTEAKRELTKVIARDPKNRNAQTLLADCHLRLGENKQVIDLVTPLERADPNDLAWAYLLGTALIHEKRYEQGGVFIDKILRREDSAEAHVLMGEARQGVKDNVRAVQDFARAAELNPDLPGVHTLHGLALLDLDDRAAAEEAFRKALAHDPNDFEASRQLGILAKLHGRDEEALAHFEHALQLRPDALDVSYEMATLMITLGRLDDALARLQAIVKEAPSFLKAHVSLATLYYRTGRKEDGDSERQIVERLREEQRQETEKADAAAKAGAAQTPAAEATGQ